MVNDEVRRAQEFRDIAARLRLLARRSRSPEARRQLIELADRFEDLAGTFQGEEPYA